MPEDHSSRFCVESVTWQHKSQAVSVGIYIFSIPLSSEQAFYVVKTTITVFLHKLASYKLQQRHCQNAVRLKRTWGLSHHAAV